MSSSSFRAPAGAATLFSAEQKIRLGRLDALRSSHSVFLGRNARSVVSVPSSSSSSRIQAVSTVRFDISSFIFLYNHKESSAFGKFHEVLPESANCSSNGSDSNSNRSENDFWFYVFLKLYLEKSWYLR